MLLFYVLIFWLQGMWDLSSPTRGETCIPCTGKQSLNHWTAREVPHVIILDSFKIYWKSWPLSSLIWQFQRSFPPSHLGPLISWLYFRRYWNNNCIILIKFQVLWPPPLHLQLALSRTPTPTGLGLNWDLHPSTLPLLLCPLSSHLYFSYSKHSFHGPWLYLYPHRCPQHKCSSYPLILHSWQNPNIGWRYLCA